MSIGPGELPLDDADGSMGVGGQRARDGGGQGYGVGDEQNGEAGKPELGGHPSFGMDGHLVLGNPCERNAEQAEQERREAEEGPEAFG